MDKKALLDLVAKVDPEAMNRVSKALDEMSKDGSMPAMDERAQTALKAATRILLPFKQQIKDQHLASALDAAGFFDETSDPGSPMAGYAGREHEENPQKSDDGEDVDELEKAFGSMDDEEDEEDVDKAKLESETRDKLSEDSFAMPQDRSYPIQDLAHARNALARSSGKPEEGKVRSAVYAKWPSLKKAMDCYDGRQMAGKMYKTHMEKLGYQMYPDLQPRMKAMSLRKAAKPTKEEDKPDKGGHDVSKSEPVLKADGTLNLEAVPEESRPFVEIIHKAQLAAVEKADKLEKALADERGKRELTEFVSKAKSFDKLGMDSDELGALLLKVSKSLTAEEYSKLEAKLKAANEQVSKGGLFDELGTRREETKGNAWEKIEAGAAAMVSKSGEKISKAESVEKFLTTEEGRKLQLEYELEKGRKF